MAVAEEDFQAVWVLALAHSMVDQEARAKGPLPGFWHVQKRGPGGPRLEESAGSRPGLNFLAPRRGSEPSLQAASADKLRDGLWT